MKQKLISRLSMISVCALPCLCIACAKQDNISFSPYPTKSLSSTISPTARLSGFPDITAILNTQDTDKIQDVSIIEYTAHTTLTSPVAIIMYSEKRSTEAVNDRTIYTSTCTYPVVTIDGNEKVTDKINADIQAIVDDFYADTSYPEWTKDDYEEYYNTNLHSYYSNELLFTVARADSNVISFLITRQRYSGGAHDKYSYTGLNYDARTGELIDFSDLSENADAFHQDTLAFHQSLAASNSYKSIMWPDDVTWKEDYDLEEVLYQDGRWYLSTSGLVFFSNPYELGAFFAGKIEFTIPYSDLEEMGFQEKYAYDGPKTILMQTEEVCFFDLNGDGQDEEIQFYIEQPGIGSTKLHFIINSTDYAMQHEELASQFSDNHYLFCWAKCFLYDMDTEDDAIEIAFQMNTFDWDEDRAIPTTFFYCYDKNGQLDYLGTTESGVTNPTIVDDFMPAYDTIMENRIIYTG